MKRLVPYLHYLKPVIPQLVVALLAGLVFGAMGGALPLLIKFMLPKIFNGDQRQVVATGTLALYCSFPAIVMLVRGVAGFTNTYLLGFCSVHLTIELQQQVFDRLQRLSLTSIRKFKDGDLLTRINGDVNVVRIALVELVQELVKQPATLIASIAAIVWLCLQKSEIAILLMLLALLPACIIPIRIIGRNMKRRAWSMQGQVGELFNHVAQNLRSVREVRAYSMEDSESAKFTGHLMIFRRFFLKIAKYNIILSPIIETISALGVGGALFYAYRGSIGAEDLAALLTAIYLCYEPVKKLGTLHNKLEQAMASLDRVEEVLHEPITIRDPENPAPVSRLMGRIEFRKLTFAYADTPVLHQLSNQLDAGRTYALVGPSGAGKSTFANLIPRFYDPGQGAVLIDGIDIRQMRLRDLRRNIAIVAQEPVLFDDTVYKNILIGNPQATREQVLDAARRAYAHDFITELEKGYDTQAGQAGGRLSGGQRQRIALARAFLKDAPILILDEATSALDAMSEQYIQQALAELMLGRTVIIIAHRFSSIQHADHILVFDQGRIVETGDHNELLARGGLYANLYRTQSGGLTRD